MSNTQQDCGRLTSRLARLPASIREPCAKVSANSDSWVRCLSMFFLHLKTTTTSFSTMNTMILDTMTPWCCATRYVLGSSSRPVRSVRTQSVFFSVTDVLDFCPFDQLISNSAEHVVNQLGLRTAPLFRPVGLAHPAPPGLHLFVIGRMDVRLSAGRTHHEQHFHTSERNIFSPFHRLEWLFLTLGD